VRSEMRVRSCFAMHARNPMIASANGPQTVDVGLGKRTPFATVGTQLLRTAQGLQSALPCKAILVAPEISTR
jgi:hypothetical protein